VSDINNLATGSELIGAPAGAFYRGGIEIKL
jgi:hypothetical protein